MHFHFSQQFKVIYVRLTNEPKRALNAITETNKVIKILSDQMNWNYLLNNLKGIKYINMKRWNNTTVLKLKAW